MSVKTTTPPKIITEAPPTSIGDLRLPPKPSFQERFRSTRAPSIAEYSRPTRCPQCCKRIDWLGAEYHDRIVDIITKLSRRIGEPVDEILRRFLKHLG
jgi:hypothetical protein